MNLAEATLFHAANAPSRPAIATPRVIVSYGDLASAARGCAARLRDRNIGAGAIVAIDVLDIKAHIAIILACELVGAASMSVQTVATMQPSGVRPDLMLIDRYPATKPSCPTQMVDAGWFANAPPSAGLAYPHGEPHQLARVILSSGTTGIPKAIAISRAAFTARLHQFAIVFPAASFPPRSMCMMGLSGLGGYLILADGLMHGGLVGFANGPEETLRVIQTHRISSILMSPGQLQFLADAQGRREPPPSLRRLMVGGSRIQFSLLQQAQARLCTNVIALYGSTECGLVAQASAAAVEGVDGVAGFALPWARVEAVDDADRPLPPGEEGIIRTRSEGQSPYLAPAPEDDLVQRAGWFYPGDVGHIREDGLIIVTGRVNELINRGGAKLAPELLEQLLKTRPGILDAAVFGVTSANGLETIWAAIVKGDGFDEAATLRFCREQMPGKAPSIIRAVTTIPRSDSGKILREQLKAALARSS